MAPRDHLDLWWRWTVAVVAVVFAFGLSLVALQRPWQTFFDWMYFGSDPAPERFPVEAADHIRFTYAVLGATIAGWMTALGGIVLGPLRRSEPWAWRTVVSSIAVWFAVDTILSLAAGYPENALLNCGFLALFVPGLAGTRPRRS